MKTKIFFLLAALLLNVCAFAQSENTTPLKGDVNNDGTVDVADINAVIEIMKNGGGTGEETKYYFSVGTTVPNVDNYTTVNGATTTIPTTKEFTNNSGGKASVYVLAPSNKTVTIKDTNMNIEFTDVYEDTSITIQNHKVWTKTSKVGNGGSITVVLN